jgi:hypothetical protein
MLRNQEPDRNIGDLTNEEIYSAIHYLEPHSEWNERQEDGGRLTTAIVLLVLLFGVIAFIWSYV